MTTTPLFGPAHAAATLVPSSRTAASYNSPMRCLAASPPVSPRGASSFWHPTASSSMGASLRAPPSAGSTAWASGLASPRSTASGALALPPYTHASPRTPAFDGDLLARSTRARPSRSTFASLAATTDAGSFTREHLWDTSAIVSDRYPAWHRCGREDELNMDLVSRRRPAPSIGTRTCAPKPSSARCTCALCPRSATARWHTPAR